MCFRRHERRLHLIVHRQLLLPGWRFEVVDLLEILVLRLRLLLRRFRLVDQFRLVGAWVAWRPIALLARRILVLRLEYRLRWPGLALALVISHRLRALTAFEN